MTASDAHLDDLLASLDLDQVCALTAGSGPWHTTPIPEAGIGRLKVTDGPTGARGDLTSGTTSACFPVGIALGATWDPDALEELGAALATEARDKGAHVLLGPTVNLHRTPLAGRTFECYAEDPWLTGALATGFVRGVQGGGIGVCIKHLVANDSEFERMTISSEVDERTLREVLLRPFEVVVADADPWSIMGAYNRVNGTYACAHPWLLTTVLRQEWGWDGVVISDWHAVHDTVGPATAGCDLEMPGPAAHLGPHLAEAVRIGTVDEDVVRANARRLLRLLDRAGVLADPDEVPEAGPDRPEHRALARRLAAAGTVLLRHEPAAGDAAPLLPLDPGALTSVAVIGPRAELSIQGGGASVVLTHPVGRFVPALAERLGDGVAVTTAEGCTANRFPPTIARHQLEAGDDGRSVTCTYFAGRSLDGEPVATHRYRRVGATWFGGNVEGLDAADFSCRYEASFVPEVDGPHRVSLLAVGRSRLVADGRLVLDGWSDPRPGTWMFGYGNEEVTTTLDLRAGQPVDLVVEYATGTDGRPAAVRLGIEPSGVDDALLAEAERVAADAEVAVVVVGTDGEWETEGSDRPSMDLPRRQDELVRRVVAANPRTVVVVNAGSPQALPWAEDVPALLQVWFPGYEGAGALVDVLVGDVEPSGRLPCTIPVSLADNPAVAAGPASYPGEGGEVRYAEGVLLGYRGHDAAGTPVRFPFGHGLGYTSWTYGEPTVGDAGDGALTVTVPLTNDGDRGGTEVVQVYLEAPEGDLVRPRRQLVGSTKVTLDAGETCDVAVDVDPRALEVWDPAVAAFRTLPGTHLLHVGRSSRDLRGSVAVER